MMLALMACLAFSNRAKAQFYKSNSDYSLIYNAWTNDPVVQIRDGYQNNSAEAAKLELVEYNDAKYNLGAYLSYDGLANKFHIGTNNYGTYSSAITVIRSGGRVGIGTENPASGFMLSVNGRIKSKGILCSVDGWADFVFHNDYQLRPLGEVESFIATNGHLPEIPSEKEVMENGIDLQVMDRKLLQKVEELTLYVIEQQKQLETLQQQLESLKK